MKKTRSEVAKIGNLAGKKTRDKLFLERKSFYELTPKLCKFCLKPIPYSKRENDFCGMSCSASFNNKGVKRHGSSPKNCLLCNCKLNNSKSIFCSRKCHSEFRKLEKINRWIKGEVDGGSFNDYAARYIRNYLLKQCEGKCAICGQSEWMGKPIPLVCDHISGDATDNSPRNLRMICRNCNGQLPTFAGRNKGNGRKFHRNKKNRGYG